MLSESYAILACSPVISLEERWAVTKFESEGDVLAVEVSFTCAALPAVVIITGLPAAIAPSATKSIVLPAGGRSVKFAPDPLNDVAVQTPVIVAPVFVVSSFLFPE